MNNLLNKLQQLMQNKMLRIFVIAILFIIILMIIVFAAIGGKAKTITSSGLLNAAKIYMADNSALLPKDDYDSKTISLSTLVSGGYLNSESEGAACASYVTVVNINDKYFYTPYIKCGKEGDTSLLINKILNNVVTTGAGLYNYNGSYIFRGDNPNNYVLLGGRKWRIIGLDESNNIKIIYSDIDPEDLPWDDRYNSALDSQSGINDYKISRAKEYLDAYFAKYPDVFTETVKSKLSKHNVCIGKVNMNNTSVNSCTEVLEDQIASMITVNDYMNASLDSSCSTTNAINCQNYNFLSKNTWTVTANSEDTVGVYCIDRNYGVRVFDAYLDRFIIPVISLRNNVIFSSGTGTKADPYVIK